MYFVAFWRRERLFMLAILVIIAGMGGLAAYINVSSPDDGIYSIEVPSINRIKPISSIRTGVLPRVPQGWGDAQEINVFQFQGKYLPNSYVITFTNSVKAVYQMGSNILYWKKAIANSAYAHGFYNLQEKHTTLISIAPRNIPDPDAVYFTYTDSKKPSQNISNSNTVALFSPQGQYAAIMPACPQLCPANIIVTKTGTLALNAGELLNFFDNENIIIARSSQNVTGQPYFMVYNAKKHQSYDLLALLDKFGPAIGADNQAGSVIGNPVQDIIITAANNLDIDFKVLNNSNFYKVGQYHFSFIKNKFGQ